LCFHLSNFYHIYSTDKEIGCIEAAHESIVWTLAWHPIGHILCSGSNDHTVKFWTRNRPGDQMRDKYNLNTLPPSLAGLEDYEMDEHVIPGMGGMNEDRVEFGEPPMILSEPPPPIHINQGIQHEQIAVNGLIPGLDLDVSTVRDKKVPYNKPIPKNFQASWNIESNSDEMFGITAHDSASILTCVRDVVSKMIHRIPGIIPLEDLKPEKIEVYGKEIDVCPGSKLHGAILEGFDSLHNYIHSGDLEELSDLVPYEDFTDYTAEDFIEDHATKTVGDDDDVPADPNQENDGSEDFEPKSKRLREDFDDYDNEGSNDCDMRYGGEGPGIPSLLNLNVGQSRHGQLREKTAEISPNSNSPWEDSNFNSGAFGGNQNANNKPPPANNNTDRRDTREGRRGSRWSSRR
jgi:hypothetical protein